mgnify:CR=1 FL=1
MKDIRTYQELEAVVQDGQVNESIVIRGGQIQSLGKVRKIAGSLGLSESSLSDLGELEIIEGNFWTSNHAVALRLQSLGNLKHVSGDVTLRYSNIKSLGHLEEVEGRLSLRDTPITSLGLLKTVHENLFLPQRFRDSEELSQIEVRGTIKFWKDSLETRPIIQDNSMGEILSSQKPPRWDFDQGKGHLYQCCSQIYHKSQEIKDFYLYFRDNILNNKQVFIDGNDNYAYTLALEFKEGLVSQFTISELRFHVENITSWYPLTKEYLAEPFMSQIKASSDFTHLKWAVNYFKPLVNEENAERLIKAFSFDRLQTLFRYSDEFRDSIAKIQIEKLETDLDYSEAWEVRKATKQFDVRKAKEYEKRLGGGITDGNVIFHLLGGQCLTAFGHKHLESILSVCTENIHCVEEEKQEPYLHSVWWTKLEDMMRNTIRAAENKVRVDMGVPKVGEGWVSETELFYFLKEHFPNYKIQQHASPKWLGRQHLDIYFSEYNIAVEYQGEQHSRPIDFFGGEAAFQKNKERDRRKMNLCAENGCHLIYAYPEDEHLDIKQKIKNVLDTI